MKKLEIWQLAEGNSLQFCGYDFTLRQAGRIDQNAYRKVWEGKTESDDLEEIFTRFNVLPPEDFRGHSLSVSDAVKLGNIYYFCDCTGWKKLKWRDWE